MRLMPGIWHQAGCCCGPCGPCSVDQPALEATIGGACDPSCADAAGTHAWALFDGDSPEGSLCCAWTWASEEVEDWKRGQVTVLYSGTNKHWYAVARWHFGLLEWFGGGVEPPLCSEWGFGPNKVPVNPDCWKDITGLISCNTETGLLSGAFTLDGRDLGYEDDYDCTGCTMEVTLGG